MVVGISLTTPTYNEEPGCSEKGSQYEINKHDQSKNLGVGTIFEAPILGKKGSILRITFLPSFKTW